MFQQRSMTYTSPSIFLRLSAICFLSLLSLLHVKQSFAQALKLSAAQLLYLFLIHHRNSRFLECRNHFKPSTWLPIYINESMLGRPFTFRHYNSAASQITNERMTTDLNKRLSKTIPTKVEHSVQFTAGMLF